jgi:alkanesulfonate monooxygenase SsuD/methylene tetrahydromethanopterin reductase-like flavin-dependent oxidoreductase (luciferase family)
MALKDKIPFGMSLPHRASEPLDAAVTRRVAERADRLGFSDLWVTENTLDHVYSLDPIVALTYAAAVTTHIGLGVAVVILPVHNPARLAHQIATLDFLSNGRAIGLGRPDHYGWFQVPQVRRVRRFNEALEIIKRLWAEPNVSYQGELLQLEGGTMPLKPVRKPHPPIWLGGGHPDSLQRAATVGDGWMGAGGSSNAEFARSVPLLRAALEKAGRDPAAYPISKRVFLSVHERPEVARAELDHWFREVYHNPKGVDTAGVHGTPEQVAAQLEGLIAAGANHLLLNPVARYEEQLDALASVVGLA